MTRQNPKHERPSNRRPTIRLGQELEKSLSAYVAAALSAGASLLAITRSAEAKIVYTPAKVNIPINGGPVPIDLNHDGITDFVLSNFFRTPTTYPPFSLATLVVGTGAGNTRNKFWGRGYMAKPSNRFSSNRFVAALRPGLSVGANKSYFRKSPKGLMARLWVFYRSALLPRVGPAGASCSPHTGGCYSWTSGQWMYTKNRYLGLQFTISGHIHYGWARVTVTRGSAKQKNSILATLIGYAYETVANKPIITGKTKGPDVVTLEPATLGRLGQGASGISTWRAKK